MVVGSDLDVIEMFRLYYNTCPVDLYVEVSDVEGPEILGFQPPPPIDFPHEHIDVDDDSSDHEWDENTINISDNEGEEFHVDAGGRVRLAAVMLFGDVTKFREALRDFTIQEGCKIVREKNEKSRVTCRLTPIHNPVFKRFFISFEATKTGFMADCRPFIGIDGCHLKGPFGGVLSAAIGRAGNNGFGQSDAEMVPEASHRTSCQHLFNNFKKFPVLLLKKYFWQAARAYSQLEFGYAMERVKSVSTYAHKWLSEVPPTAWSRHAFNEGSPSGGKELYPTLCGGPGSDEYEVLDEGMTYCALEVLNTHRCTCNEWQISGIPCRHAAAAIKHRRDQRLWEVVNGDIVEPPPLRRLPGIWSQHEVMPKSPNKTKECKTVRGVQSTPTEAQELQTIPIPSQGLSQAEGSIPSTPILMEEDLLQLLEVEEEEWAQLGEEPLIEAGAGVDQALSLRGRWNLDKGPALFSLNRFSFSPGA
ncbi:hypothetical protein Acr_18g0010670 [Actinidia rufa]|uniref:SWIM-type domain-containing protein n=1 Tax=Actinidia rufa TaxID=165716 RepID=A0A7J0G7X6_9ERIC|nr:hypothetical protein Acr_18g0010670 [Actinidia rufa]